MTSKSAAKPHHNCDHTSFSSIKNLGWAVFINLLLTVVQIVAGLLSSSLSLIADGIHNLSDASSLLIALFAEKISLKKPTEDFNFGYGRSKIIAAFINSLLLLSVAIFIIYEVYERFSTPVQIDGWTVIITATIALVIDLLTAKLTHGGSEKDINLRAAFIHNLVDAFSSLLVIISGALILFFEFYWSDLLASLLITVFIIYNSWDLLKKSISILMDGVPYTVDYQKVKTYLLSYESVQDLKDLKIWCMNENNICLSVTLKFKSENMNDISKEIKAIKSNLHTEFSIHNCSIEIF